MNNRDLNYYFECLGEIWRDITAIEFLMRCSIAKKDEEIGIMPKPPFTKGKIYKEYPKSFSNLSFEIVANKFNKRYPEIQIPQELIDLRNAMAHGLIVEIDNRGVDEIVKFRETDNKLRVEFSMTLEQKRIAQIRQSLKELRGYIMEEVDDNN